ncbi:hypothetical protein [Calycomorphotria hydatis]|uniref:Uncharacterized protein n=1 Tax=Calycomorphotria hydatis TaxID=2528027 RepID=A0A517T3W6_9PLAN|nr:hypothetical protein [Calycomorphotria hydatis]QDT63067.1 hypothetical protein V22_02670 [Calycomorphotria hydatis]
MGITDYLAWFVFAVYALAFSLGAVVWSVFYVHWMFAIFVSILALFYWGNQLICVFSSTSPSGTHEHEPHLSTGQIDHPGGGIGVMIGVGLALHIVINWEHTSTNLNLAFAVLIFSIPLLGIPFSLLSEFIGNWTVRSLYRYRK